MMILKYGNRISFKLTKSLITMLHQTKGIKTKNTKEPKILFEKVGTAGVVTFNHPKLNLMVYSIIGRLLPVLQNWERTQSRVILKGAGHIFSAGADLHWLLAPEDLTIKIGVATQANNIHRISKYRIPVISLMDGISFGAPLMLGVTSKATVVTERTLIAMPECRIGWFPDGGSMYFLPRLDNHLGYYMALTGKRLTGKDVVLSGLATHFVPSARMRDLEAELCRCGVEEIEACLDAYKEPLGKFSLAPVMGDIDHCFSADTVEEILDRVSKLNNAWSKETLEMIRPLCPTMLKVALRALQIGKNLNLKQALEVDHRVLSRCIGSYNAQEGLRSLLVQKTNSPNWRPQTLAEVTDAMVDSYFAPLPEGEEIRLYD